MSNLFEFKLNADELKINVDLNITHETAVLCAGLLDMFCSMQRGDKDITYKACISCPLMTNGFCNYRHMPILAVEED